MPSLDPCVDGAAAPLLAPESLAVQPGCLRATLSCSDPFSNALFGRLGSALFFFSVASILARICTLALRRPS